MKNIIRKSRYWRLLETIPGALTWLGLLLPVVVAIFKPAWVAIFIIIYTAIWLFRSLKLSINMSRSYLRMREAIQIDWYQKLQLLDPSGRTLEKEIQNLQQKKLKESLKKDLKKLQVVIKKNQFLDWREIYHAIIFVTYKEGMEVVESSIDSYINSSFPSKKIIFIYAGEEREGEAFIKRAKILRAKYAQYFKEFIITVHPQDLPGEIVGKSANCTFAGKKLKKYLDDRNLAYEKIIVSNFDADTVTHKHYFSELTYKYAITEDRVHKAYQPTHMFHNNIWDVPVLVRMVALACTFFRLAESMEIMKFKSFSSRSNSFQTIIDVDFWDPAVIPEDSRQFWTAYTIYNGKHSLVPLRCPLYLDAVLSNNYLKTFQSQYSQLRRWAWGASDFPFVFLNLLKNKNIPLGLKIYHIFFFLENSFFWATGPLILTFTGWLPGLIHPTFNDTLLAYQAPRIASNLLTISTSGILLCAIFSIILVPKRREKKHPFLDWLSLSAQWMLVPIVSIILSAIPAIDAQTRLLLGYRLEYKVTPKVRKSENSNQTYY